MATLVEIPSLLRIRDAEDHNAVSGGELRAGCEMPTAFQGEPRTDYLLSAGSNSQSPNDNRRSG
jgi:hypothetical protein